MQTLEEQLQNYYEKVDSMPKNITLEQATMRDNLQSIQNALPTYKDNSALRFAKGALSGLQGVKDFAPSLEIYGRQIDLAVGGYFGYKPETINRKALNLSTAYRNLQTAQKERFRYANPENVNSWAFGLGQGAFNYGSMLIVGGLSGVTAKALGINAIKTATVTGLTTNALLENIEQQSERMPLNKENQIDVNQITPEWARKSAIGTTAYLGVSTILERGFGFGKQLRMWETPIKTSNKALKISSPVLKQAGKTALSEGLTEGLQSLSSTGILLLEGKINVSQLPERLQDAWKEAVIGGILGGVSGSAVAINQQHNVKTMLNEEISKVVENQEEVEKIVDAIYDTGTAEMTNVISKELELSSELNAKHGAIYDNMTSAIYDAINEAGAFNGIPESEIAQYVSDTSKMFANQVLAEANKRGVLIDEVLKASDIKFENGKIRLQAGKNIIVETPIVQTEVKAELKIGENRYNDIIEYAKNYPEYLYSNDNPIWQEYEKLTPDEQEKATRKFNEILNVHEKVKNKSLKELKDDILSNKFEYKKLVGEIHQVNGKTPKFVDVDPQNNSVIRAEREFNNIVSEFWKNPIEALNNLEYYKQNLENAIGQDEYKGFPGVEEKYRDRFYKLVESAKMYAAKQKTYIDTNLEQRKTYKELFSQLSDDIKNNTISDYGQSGDRFKYIAIENKNIEDEAEKIYEDINKERDRALKNATTKKQREKIYDTANSKLNTAEKKYQKDKEEIQKKVEELKEMYKSIDDTLYQSAETAGAENNEVELAKKEWEEKGTESKYFKKWFGDSKVVDENGKPLVVYHGSVNTFEIFDKDRASAEGDMDAGFYFTDNESDVNDNYYDGGPDFDNKVSRLAEQIQQDKEDEGEDIDYDEAKEIAEKQLKGESKKYEVYLDIKNPCYVGENETLLLSDVFDDIEINEEDYEDYEVARQEAEEEKLQTISYDLDDALGGLLQYEDIEKARGILFEYLYDGGVSLQQLKDRLNEEYFEDYDGNFVANEVARRIVEALGYDGIIDNSVADKFSNMGMESGTTHYIVFKPEQVKSIENQGTFDAENPNIYMQLENLPKQKKVYKGSYNVSEKAIELFKDADYSTLPHEFAHFWLDNMWGFSRSGKASEAYMNNFNAVLDWLGVKDSQTYFTTAQQEKFAKGYEKYLLNGYAPNGLIQGAFDDYDKWLKKVYNDARELKVKLNADAINFFDTMTTGELPEYNVPETQQEIIQKNIEQVNKDIETTKKVIVEKQATFNNAPVNTNTIPVDTEGKKEQSRAYTKQSEILSIAEELNYNMASIKEQNRLAEDFVKNNFEQAEKIVNGQAEAPSNILKNAIYNAYLKQMLAIGNNEAYIDALKNQSLELTRAGQEIASQRGAIDNIFDAGYWIKRIEANRKVQLANKKFGSFDDYTGENAVSKMNKFIQQKVDAVMERFLSATTEEQQQIAEKLSKDIAAEFKVKSDKNKQDNEKPGELYQTLREPTEIRTRTNAYNYIYKSIYSELGISLTKQQADEVIAKTSQMQKSMENTRNIGGNPSVLFFKNMSEMENFANSLQPTPSLTILTSVIGRGNMVMSPKTILLNIESNIINFLTEMAVKRAVNKTSNLAVDSQVIKDYLNYSREVYKASGYQVSSMPELDATTQILSEKMTTSQGPGKIRALGRFFEQTIFKYGLGYPDLIFKDMTFVDTVNMLATQEAKGDSKKATEIFKDACLIEPKTAIGKEIREQAINDALVATYQNKGEISDFALKVRRAINDLTRQLRLGDMLSPFVKTPANVIGLGFDYSMGGLRAIVNFGTIVNDVKSGYLTDTTKQSMRSLARNGLGLVASFIIASMIDDDDYIPEYALLSNTERKLVKLKGGVFNSIKIGDKYISLDYFGPLAMPLVSILNARRGKNIQEQAFRYVQGSAYQSLKLPVIGDIKELLEGTGRTLSQDLDAYIKMVEETTIDFVSSRSIPALISDVAKMTDEFERETNNKAFNRLMTKVPIAREQLPLKYSYGTGRPIETQSPITILLAGARVKEEVSNSVIREIDKLSKKNTAKDIILGNVTKTGLLSGLSDEKKIKVEREFSKKYANDVNILIHTNRYQMLDDDDKVKAINKVRDDIVDDIKKEYGLTKRGKKK